MIVTNHFAQRCLERGIIHDPEDVAKEIGFAIKYGRDDYAEKVKSLNGKDIFRVNIIGSGIMYAMVEGKKIVTILTQDMMQGYRKVSKGKVKSALHYSKVKENTGLIQNSRVAAKLRRKI